MNTNTLSRKIRWRCHRGMLELDIILLSFFDKSYAKLTEAEQKSFIALLESPDPVLYAWLIGQEEPSDDFDSIVQLIREEYAAR